MRPANLVIPEPDPNASFGRWVAPSPCDTLDSVMDLALDSALKTPEEGDPLHAPLWGYRTANGLSKKSPRSERSKLPSRNLDNNISIVGSDQFPRSVHGERSWIGFDSASVYNHYSNGHEDEIVMFHYSPPKDIPQTASSTSTFPVIPDEDDLDDTPYYFSPKLVQAPLPVVAPLSPKPRKLEGRKVVPATRLPARQPAPLSPKPRKAENSKPIQATKPPTRQPTPIKLKTRHISPVTHPRASTLSFAAIWDPDSNGMKTFSGSQLLRNNSQRRINGKVTPVPSRLATNGRSLPRGKGVGGDSVPRRPAGLPFISKASTLPTSPKAHLRPNLPIRSASEGDAKQANRNFSIVDDEGFFENPQFFSPPEALNAVVLPGHEDCDPHLPSRWSTTTTSTDRYIHIDFPPEDTVRRVAMDSLLSHSQSKKSRKNILGKNALGITLDSVSSPNLSATRSLSPPPTRSKSPPVSGRYLPNSPSGGSIRKLPSLLGKLKRGSKHNDGWVNVEVMTVIRERANEA